MIKSDPRRLFFSPLVFSLLFLSMNLSCSRYQVSRMETAPGDLLLSPAPDFNSPTFRFKESGAATESDKIRYLLNRIGNSNDLFIRNEEIYPGQKAKQWLFHKMGHWVSGVKTAQDFIERVASYSQKTGRPYWVKTPDGKTYPLRGVLQNELNALALRSTGKIYR